MKKMIVFLLFFCVYNVGFCDNTYVYHTLKNGKKVFVKKDVYNTTNKEDLNYFRTYLQVYAFKTKRTEKQLESISKEINHRVEQIKVDKFHHVVLKQHFQKNEKQLTSILADVKSKKEDARLKHEYDQIISRPRGAREYDKASKTNGNKEKINQPIIKIPKNSNPSNKAVYFKIQLFASPTQISKYDEERYHQFFSHKIKSENSSKNSRFPYRYVSDEYFNNESDLELLLKKIRSNDQTKEAFIVAYDYQKNRLN